ncbi:MAG: thioesterase family protein [Clostridium sp.]|nr:thioesterase family protein [Clostridium sp.]
METGIRGMRTVTVTEDMTAKAVGSGELPVFATPAMIALIEETCWRSVADRLAEGEGTVGIKLEVSHLAASPVGMTVRCESELAEIDGRKLTFCVEVSDDRGKIGEGTHERFIVGNERFLKKAEARRDGI